MAAIPTIARLNEVFRLDPETGVLWRRISTSSRAQAGTEAGYLHLASGYLMVNLDGALYRQHLLIWLMLHGEWCPREIDHVDRDRSNNRPANLRKASESQQRQNASLRSDNTSGYRGVTFQAGKYVARTYVDGKQVYLGCFESSEAAAEAARQTRLQHYGAYAPAYDHEVRT